MRYRNLGIIMAIIISGADLCVAAEQAVKFIEKSQAKYDTPENAMDAWCSAIKSGDVEWYFESVCEELRKRHEEKFKTQSFKEAFMNQFKFNAKTLILKKEDYKGSVKFTCEMIESYGVIIKGPISFIKENDKWKKTEQFNQDPGYITGGGVTYPKNMLNYGIVESQVKKEKLEDVIGLLYSSVSNDRIEWFKDIFEEKVEQDKRQKWFDGKKESLWKLRGLFLLEKKEENGIVFAKVWEIYANGEEHKPVFTFSRVNSEWKCGNIEQIQ